MTTPRVSVITPVYNDAAHVGDAIRSVRAQTIADWEMIVVDDGSSDGSAEAARAAAQGDGRVRVMSVANGGVSRARNLGLAEARGDTVHFLDSDDWIEPSCYAHLLSRLAAHPDAVLAAASSAAADESGRRLETFRTPAMPDPVGAFARTCVFPVHAALTRADALRAIGGFDERLPACEDWDLWLRLARQGGAFVSTPDVLVTYRRRAGSLTRDSLRMARALATVIPRAFDDDARWEMIDALMASLFYVAGGAIVLGHDMTPVWAETPDLTGWRFDASVAAYGVTAGMRYALAAGNETPAAKWRSKRDHAHRQIGALAARIGARRDCDLLLAHLEARLLGAGAFETAWTSPVVDAATLDVAKDEVRRPADATRVVVRAVHRAGAALGSVEAPDTATLRPALAAEARAWTCGDALELAATLVTRPTWSARQILSRQPERPSRAAFLEAAHAAAGRVKAARLCGDTRAMSAATGATGAPAVRAPLVVAQRGRLAQAVALVDALANEGYAPIGVADWVAASACGLAPRGRRYALALAAELGAEDDPSWLALVARGVAPLILAPLDAESPARGWTWASMRACAGRGAQIGWAAPRDIADQEEAGALAERAADIVEDLSALAGVTRPIAALAAGGGSRFATERLRAAGFAGVFGRLVGAAHLDDSVFDLRSTPIDLDAPIDRLARIVTDA
ncbi:MAG: glycosyltransferase [Alphaproteobacteria bacterium]|nr:glycosyltransferase [Alphaproteobacteria bacterium]